ncbi:cytochrome P450 [Nocardia sp. NBC_01503]|uniref:cytochrome P450 n=1 Tax=Nocardia sp. NBC_01503 TaxID=2975997 RepID=UPI002E7BF0C4|nr:cytochrome P450 [Nocardia sp. NBC_01503]WTL29145.1 cytochrome P450 [Nocardia sp. NBC_01503]
MTRPDIAPGPRLPIGVRRYRADAAAIMRELHREYGDIARFRVGPQLMHQITGPALIPQVLHDKTGAYRRGKVYGGFELFFGKGSLTTDGEQWRTLRTAGQPFFRAGYLRPNVPTIAAVVRDMFQRWEDAGTQGESVDIVPEMMRLAFEVVTRVLCGIDMSDRATKVVPTIREVLSAMFPGSPEQLLPTWLPGPVRQRVRNTQAVLDGVGSSLITAHLEGGLPPDRLVGGLFDAIDPATGAPLTRRQIIDELKTYLLAGHETTGCGLAWTLHELAAHPEVAARLAAEVDQVLDDRTPEAADLARLPYLSQVVDEALRLHPPIPMFPRETTREIEIGGYRIPAATTLFISSHTVHHDPRHWPDPDAFDPDRFAPDRPKPLPYTYFPFGGGARRCIGAPLAELEIQVAVAMILQRYHLEPQPGHPVREQSLISLRPRFGLPMIITRRQTRVDR